jgi:hypothetical protein
MAAHWLNCPAAGNPRVPDGKPNLSKPTPRTPDGRPDLLESGLSTRHRQGNRVNGPWLCVPRLSRRTVFSRRREKRSGGVRQTPLPAHNVCPWAL